MMILKEFSRIVCVSLFSYQGSLLVCLSDSLFTLPHLIDCVKYFFEVFYFFKNFSDIILIRYFPASRTTVCNSHRIFDKILRASSGEGGI